MTKKNMFRVAAVLMACVMMFSSFSFAVTETHAGATGYVTFACSAGLTSASASTSSTNGANYCTVTLSAEYGAGSRAIGGTYATNGSNSSSGQGYGVATAGVSYNGMAEWAVAESEHRAPGCSGTLRDSFGV